MNITHLFSTFFLFSCLGCYLSAIPGCSSPLPEWILCVGRWGVPAASGPGYPAHTRPPPILQHGQPGMEGAGAGEKSWLCQVLAHISATYSYVQHSLRRVGIAGLGPAWRPDYYEAVRHWI